MNNFNLAIKYHAIYTYMKEFFFFFWPRHIRKSFDDVLKKRLYHMTNLTSPCICFQIVPLISYTSQIWKLKLTPSLSLLNIPEPNTYK